MGQIEDCLKLYKNVTDTFFKDWENYSKDELVKLYQYAPTPHLRDVYFSALMMRYAYLIPIMKKKTLSLKLDYEDLVAGLVEAILRAFQYHAWDDPNSSVCREGDPNTVITTCVATQISRWWLQETTSHRLANHNTISFEHSVKDDDSDISTLLMAEIIKSSNIQPLYEDTLASKDVCDTIIKRLLKEPSSDGKPDIEGAMIVYMIAFGINIRTKRRCPTGAILARFETMSDKEIIDFCDKYNTDVSKVKDVIKRLSYENSVSDRSRVTLLKRKIDNLAYNEIVREELGLCY